MAFDVAERGLLQPLRSAHYGNSSNSDLAVRRRLDACCLEPQSHDADCGQIGETWKCLGALPALMSAESTFDFSKHEY